MSEFISSLIRQMERSGAGSEDTARRVMEMCGRISPGSALFMGDDLFIPQLISEKMGAKLLATFPEDFRTEAAEQIGISAKTVGAYELMETEGGWDFIWYNGGAEPEGVTHRLELLHGCLKKGGIAVYRTLCWLIDPSPDTKCYIKRRFGRPEPLDRVLREAKECGFEIRDFYISPKTDWTVGFYNRLSELVKKHEGASDSDANSGIGELNKEIYMFDLHSEEYSYIYYILRCV